MFLLFFIKIHSLIICIHTSLKCIPLQTAERWWKDETEDVIIYSIPTLTMNVIKTHWINSCKPRWLHYNWCKISWVTKDLHYKYTRTIFILQSSSCKMYLYLAIKNSHKMSTFVQIFKIKLNTWCRRLD